eukprot:13720378-Ditylum_brightwellii.AAC.1
MGELNKTGIYTSSTGVVGSKSPKTITLSHAYTRKKDMSMKLHNPTTWVEAKEERAGRVDWQEAHQQ